MQYKNHTQPDLTLVPKEAKPMNPIDPFGVMPQFQKMMEMFQQPSQHPFNTPQPESKQSSHHKQPQQTKASTTDDPLGLEKMLNPLGLPIPDAVKMLLPVVSNPVNQFNFLTSNAQAAMLQMVMLQQSGIASMMALMKLIAPQFNFPMPQYPGFQK